MAELSVNQISELTGIDRRTVKKRLGEAGVRPLRESKRAHIYQSAAALRAVFTGGALDLEQERARLAREQADAQELRNAIARGEQAPVDQIEAAWVALASGVRARLLAIPAKGAPEIHAAETAAAVEGVIRKYLVEALEELADAAA